MSLDLDDQAGSANAEEVRHLLNHRYRFLNVEQQLPVVDWGREYVSSLWTYRLHYFDHAMDLARAWRTTGDPRFGQAFVATWTDWIDSVSRCRAVISPYPTSVRCMNALRSLWLVEDRLDEAFADRLAASAHAELRWLAHNLEQHLRANHLQKNLTALAWGSLAFDGPAVATWNRHRSDLWSELREQVLADGGHFERSPMYHAEALDDLLRTVALCRSANVAVPDDVRERLRSMTRALQWLSRPDGTLHLFNDAANGERPGREAVLALARRVLGDEFEEPSGAFSLENTGYYGLVDPTGGRRLVLDAGPLGPSYQPGHAHCDMLSFELDLRGRPVVVDSGVHGYDGDPYREYVRSTRAHNTVQIGSRDQHEMWATFRVARRGAILEATADGAPDGAFEFRGACSHYHEPRAVHRRRIELRGESLAVIDCVRGAIGRPLASRVHLHPDFEIVAASRGFSAIAPGLRLHIDVFGTDDVRALKGERAPVQGWYCPQFGVATPAPTLELSVAVNDAREFGFRIQPQ